MFTADASRWISYRSILVALVIGAQTAQAEPLDQSMMAPSDWALLQDYEMYQHRCHGNSGDDPDTWIACGARNYIGYLLDQSGYCFGQTEQIEFEWTWHVCDKKSLRFEKP